MTEEVAELLKRTIREACPAENQCLADEDECFRAHPIHEGASVDGVIQMVYADVDGLARILADALSSSGRLVPEGSEIREEWGVRWPDGDWGMSNRALAEGYIARTPGALISRRVITTPWTPTRPEEKPDA